MSVEQYMYIYILAKSHVYYGLGLPNNYTIVFPPVRDNPRALARGLSPVQEDKVL